MQRKTGARGLRTILETVLLDTMYDLPSMRNVSKVVVDDTVIDGQTKPYVVYGTEENRLASVDEPRRASGTEALSGFPLRPDSNALPRRAVPRRP